MTNILCRRHDCVWCDPDEGVCLNTLVEVSENGCHEYDTIFDYPEYHEKFYIAACVDGVPMYRVERMGKRIEYKGRVFYTTEKTNERESFLVTDGITGAEVGTFARVKKKWAAFLAKAAEYPDVMTYPEAQIVGGKCIPITDEPEEEKPPVISTAEFTGILDDLKRMYGGDT